MAILKLLDFNPRPPWGGRLIKAQARKPEQEFQSTPSVGRATSHAVIFATRFIFQSTPSVGRATDTKGGFIAIHLIFQSTPSVGRATIRAAGLFRLSVLISIHALRGEGDDRKPRASKRMGYDFNPRPPWGGRRARYSSCRKSSQRFQSTPSVGRATRAEAQGSAKADISIHALRGEGDRRCQSVFDSQQQFQSTPSVGRATCIDIATGRETPNFNPRPPWGGRR